MDTDVKHFVYAPMNDHDSYRFHSILFLGTRKQKIFFFQNFSCAYGLTVIDITDKRYLGEALPFTAARCVYNNNLV